MYIFIKKNKNILNLKKKKIAELYIIIKFHIIYIIKKVNLDSCWIYKFIDRVVVKSNRRKLAPNRFIAINLIIIIFIIINYRK